MRDLSRFPITDDEIIECLNRLADEIVEEESPGDMRALLLREAAKRIKSSGLTPGETLC